MPAAGRSCRQPVRHSVRLSGPRRRRRLLSPDAWGPPSAARSSRGPARRRAPPPPGPAPALLPVCPSVRPPARSHFRPCLRPPALGPVSPLRSLCLSPARCLFVSVLALPHSPSLTPGSRVPFSALLSSLRASLSERPHSSGLPSEHPHIFGGFSFRTPSTPPGIPFELPAHPSGALPSICTPQIPGVLPPLSPHFLRIFPLLVPPTPRTLGPPRSLGASLLGAPKSSPVPRLHCPSLPSLGLSPVAVSPCSLSGLCVPPSYFSGSGLLLCSPCFCLPPHLSRWSHHSLSLALKAPL